MKKVFYILFILPIITYSQFYVNDNALLHVSDGTDLQIGPDLENNGAIQNLGTISLYGDWTANNNFNSSAGELSFLGSGNQMVLADELVLKELLINSSGVVTFPGSEYLVTDKIDFQFGTIETGQTTRFILGENIAIPSTTGSNDSYFAGSLIHRGSGRKFFPVGSDGVYAPLTLDNVIGFANETEIQVSYNRDNPVDPEPGNDLIGVSHRAYWELELLNGTVSDPTKLQVEFNEEDLSDFIKRNNIRHRSNSPVIAYTNNLTEPWLSLGVDSIANSDSLTFGQIAAENLITPELNQKTYLAMALAPAELRTHFLFVPEVFSPNADDVENRSFRILGTKITNEDFSLRIFNRLGIEVYSTSSFPEANEVGWDGTNFSGLDEPTGIYYYQVRLTTSRAVVVNKAGAFYLVR